MKKQSVSLLALLVAASGLFFSCNNKKSANMGALQFDSIVVNEQTHLFGDTAKPASSLTVKFTYATGADDPRLKDSLNTFFLAAGLGSAYQSLAPAEAVKRFSQTYALTYRTDLEPMYAQDMEDSKAEGREIGNWYNYYKGVEGSVMRYHNHLLVYRIDHNEYTGGAHGIYTSSFLNIDLRTLQPVRLDDLFAADYKEALTDLLWNQLMADYNATSHDELEEMGYATTGDLAPTENFFLGERDITFYYNVYEIAPYAMGPISISLPYEAVQHLLSDRLEVIGMN